MGLLTLGTPLTWHETQQQNDTTRHRAVYQLIKKFKDYRYRTNDPLRWGDEVEYIIISQDSHQVRLSTRACEILNDLIQEEDRETNWCPEYGRYMLEGTPGSPYQPDLNGLLQVERNMIYRRQQVSKYLLPNEKIITIPCYPRFGCDDFLNFQSDEVLRYTLSQRIPDNMANPHPRYHYASRNMTERKGSPFDIRIPVYQDINTKVKEIKFDSIGAGAGCCCLQLTFQAPNLEDGKFLYDCLIPLAPIFQALSNNTSIIGGMLSKYDNRWNLLEQAMDDRTPGESGKQPLLPGEKYISKSRYGSASLYLTEIGSNYNDLDLAYNQKVLDQLQSAGMDPPLAHHFSHLLQRDSILLFSEQADPDASLEGSDYFENFQSTNWQTVRFKPPPDDEIGWRVEFRPLEVQLTDFENAAFAIVVNLLVRMILSFKPNLLIPISLVDYNMKVSQQLNSINQGYFFFRPNLGNSDQDQGASPKLMTIDSIINGGDGNFIGILPMIQSYLTSSQVPPTTLQKLQPYLNFIRDRANGKAITGATYLRQFVHSHPHYLHDSQVTPTINHDLLHHLANLNYDPTSPLFGSLPTTPSSLVPLTTTTPSSLVPLTTTTKLHHPPTSTTTTLTTATHYDSPLPSTG